VTREEILALEPGRELDALVAEKVMGWTEVECFGVINNRVKNPPTPGCEVIIARGRNRGRSLRIIPCYSTDISAAWEVVEKLKETYGVEVYTDLDMSACRLFDELTYLPAEEVISNTAPEAICKAALIAVMEGRGRSDMALAP